MAVRTEHPDRTAAQQVESCVGFGERREALGLEAFQRGAETSEQARGDVVARERSAACQRRQVDPGLVDRGRLRVEAQVQADADHGVAGPGRVAAELDEDAAELASVREQVVRPFQADSVEAAIGQRLHCGDSGDEAQATERGHAVLEAFQQREREAAAQRHAPGPAAASAPRALHFGEAGEAVARVGGGAAQQFAAGRVDLPVHDQIAEPSAFFCIQGGGDLRRVEQFHRSGEAVAVPRAGFHRKAEFAQPLHLLPDRRPADAETVGEFTPGNRVAAGELAEQRQDGRRGRRGGGRRHPGSVAGRGSGWLRCNADASRRIFLSDARRRAAVRDRPRSVRRTPRCPAGLWPHASGQVA